MPWRRAISQTQEWSNVSCSMRRPRMRYARLSPTWPNQAPSGRITSAVDVVPMPRNSGFSWPIE